MTIKSDTYLDINCTIYLVMEYLGTWGVSTQFLQLKYSMYKYKICLFRFSDFRAMQNWWRYRKQRNETKDTSRPYTRWEEDYQLQDPGRLALFDEYLEMGKLQLL